MRSFAFFPFPCVGALIVTPVVAATTPSGCPDARAAEELRKHTVGLLVVGGDSCTGTLLAPKAVLTTARCVVGRVPEEVAFTLHAEGDRARGRFARAKAIHVHPRFPAKAQASGPLAADVAIVELADTQYGDPIPVFYDVVAKAEPVPSGAPAFVIGYGLNRNGTRDGRRPRRVRFHGVRPAPLSETEEVPDGLYRLVRGDDGELPCTGDSGGPLLRFAGGVTRIWGIHAVSALSNWRDAKGRWLPMSPTERCRRSDEAIATAIAPYANWIEALRNEVGGPIACPR
jgi:secreted trypsin-like serine protease